MDLKLSKLKHIPSRNKNLIFGYVKDNWEKINKSKIIPEMIKYMFLIYFNIDIDTFDKNMTNDAFEILGNDSMISLPSHLYDLFLGSGANIDSYLSNVILTQNGGIHAWKFRQNAVNWNDSIGISKISSLNLVGDLDKDGQYCFMLSGNLLESREGLRDYICEAYGEAYKTNSIIEMILDCNNKSLRWIINNKDYGKAFDIEDGSYRAAVSLYNDDGGGCDDDGEGCMVELISYQYTI